MLAQTRSIENLINNIKEIFFDNNLILGKDDEDSLKINVDLIATGKKVYLDIKELNILSDDYYIFVVCQELLKEESVFITNIKEIEKKINENLNKYIEVKVYFINDSLKNEISFKKRLNKYKSNIIGKRPIVTDYIISNDIISQKYEVKIDSRIRSLETKLVEKDKFYIRGYVFIANLYDVVKIYDSLGGQLFDYNIRKGIKDTLGVNREIEKTLIENPKEFWFLNNGITMLIQDDEFSIKKTKVLELRYGDGKKVSIINGAQTVTAAADVFFNDNNIKEARECAKVMLRIIHLDEAKQENQIEKLKQKANKISVSLNRQKPIEPEDLAYTTDFIYNINKVWEDNKEDIYTFNIVRRSKTITTGILLEDFARAATAFLAQKPGQARSYSRNKLLGIKGEDDVYSFINNIFKQEFSNKEESNLENLYKYYKPINFAITLSKYYQQSVPKLKDQIKDKNKLKIISYGKWFFVAYVIYILNDEKYDDFSKFRALTWKKETIDECIIMFADAYKNMFNLKEEKIDSNNFKNETIYKKFIKMDSTNKDKITKLKSKIMETFTCNTFVKSLSSDEVAATH